tara:strand:+ start:412 stop:891 length:480 start_codon:yes stop_codon:yes gene_type:complete
MIINNYIKIRDNYINLDLVRRVNITQASKWGSNLVFYFERGHEEKFFFDDHQVGELIKVIKIIDKKLIVGGGQLVRKSTAKKPSGLEEVVEYFKELKIKDPEENAEKFFNFYDSNNWYRGKTKIVKWKSCVKTWKLKKETDDEEINFDELLKARRKLRK